MDKEKEVDRLEEKLADAWRKTPSPPVPGGWKADLMDAVRTAAPRKRNGSAEKILVRSAIVAAIAACAMLLLVPSSALQISSELVSLVLLDPAGFLADMPLGY